MLITTFFILHLLLHVSSSEPSDLTQQPNCTNRWIHIRKLPSKFNTDLLLNCSNYPIYDNFCPYLNNHGLGLKTHNKTRSWYRTDPFMLELLFHRRMLEYDCLTDNVDVADAVFVPYYAGIDSLRYLYGSEQNSSSQHGLELYRFLQDPKNNHKIWAKRSGHDHFLVLSRPAWDFDQPLDNDPPIWGTSFLELPEFYNVTALTLESRAWPWQEVAVPYPTSFHPPNLALFESWVARVRKSWRSTLMLFAAGGGIYMLSFIFHYCSNARSMDMDLCGVILGISSSPNVRRSIRLECDNSSKTTNSSRYNGGYNQICEFVDCSNGICEHDPIRFMKPMLKSSFCLQPPGDTPTRRSTFDGILAGCIPVFFEEQSAKKQYQWHLPEEEYREFSVFIPKEDVVFKDLKIVDVLMGIPRSEVRRMREKLVELMPSIMYRKHGSSLGLRSKKDAFDVAVEGTLKRIKSRLKDSDQK